MLPVHSCMAVCTDISLFFHRKLRLVLLLFVGRMKYYLTLVHFQGYFVGDFESVPKSVIVMRS